MPSAYAADYPTDQVLSDVMSSALPGEDRYLSRRILHRVGVPGTEYKGKIFIEDERPFMGQPGVEARRAPGADAEGITDSEPTTVDYECASHMLHSGKIPVERIRRSQRRTSTGGQPLTPDARSPLERRRAGIVRRNLLLAEDLDFHDGVMDPNNFPTSTLAALGASGGTGNRFDEAGSDPIADLLLARDIAQDANNGIAPHYMVIGTPAVRPIRTHSTIRQYLPRDQNNISVSKSDLERILEDKLDLRVYISDLRRETARAGTASSQVYVFGDECFFGYGDVGADLMPATVVDGGVETSPVSMLTLYELLDEADGNEFWSGMEMIMRAKSKILYGEHCRHTLAIKATGQLGRGFSVSDLVAA